MADYWTETGKCFSSLIEKPKMTEKLLKKPPPKYIYDIILNTMKKTNFPKGLLTDQEMDHKYFEADPHHKLAILQKVIDITRIVMSENFDIKTTNILKGEQPEKTNYFLQMFYKAATNGKDNSPLIQKYLENQSKKETKKKAESEMPNNFGNESKPKFENPNKTEKPKGMIQEGGADVDNDDGDDAEHNDRHGCAQVNGAVAALQILDVDGDGHVFGAVQHQVGQQVVVPDPHGLKDTHGNEGGLEHGQDHQEEGAEGSAAVDGGSFLDLQRQALDEAHEHEDSQSCAEAQVHDGDRPGGVQLQTVGGEGQGEHDHLEGHDHGEQAQVVEDPGKQAVHTGDVPCAHGGEQQDQHHRSDGNEEAEADGLHKGIVTKGHTLGVVVKAHEAVPAGKGEGIQVNGVVGLEGVDQRLKNGHDPDDTQQDEYNGKHLAQRGITAFHYCCTSLLRVAVSWARARAATNRKKTTALAWAAPCQFLLML